MLYYDQGRYAEAEPLYRRSLAIREKALGPDHPDTAVSLNNLALLYGNQGRYAEAEPLYQRSLAIREKALGPDHPPPPQPGQITPRYSKSLAAPDLRRLPQAPPAAPFSNARFTVCASVRAAYGF